MDANQGRLDPNTDASLPQAIEQIIAAGLDSIRVSINSVREDCYNAYFRPKGYRFGDVLTSIEKAIQHGIFVSINYLNMPGITDTPEEIEALMDFVRRRPINMIQWRNLNIDPLRYYQIMHRVAGHGQPVGAAS